MPPLLHKDFYFTASFFFLNILLRNRMIFITTKKAKRMPNVR